ncbi:Capsule polysaccharide export inner-membrane protein [Roseibacterium elongatum DSM 19469]|uniref:Capsule polysaccharide export inner-membrane protein n=1 Tax=Roseicyclus elongatus DSM 19469 TaxID=1294273 RepID=W8S3K9_9RHOB|nr:Capsule polysaccharide export inner-membrane protein [Roseibacterium elongatum DSM 19469]
MAPMAGPALMRPRHFGLMLSFLGLVLIPLLVVAIYMFAVAEDQYASTTGFTVRQNETGAATDVIGGIAQFTGAGAASDADILYEFIVSQELVRRLDAQLDLVGHYSALRHSDPIYTIRPDASIEDLTDHWARVVRISFDSASGLLELRVLAFTPDMAHRLALAIISESTNLVNELNANARADAITFAQQDLESALARLRSAREALTAFRTRTQIVDPESDLQGRMGVLNNLQQQLAEALIEYDLLTENTSNQNDPRLLQADRRIEVIRQRIVQERETFTLDDIGAAGEDYPTLMAEYEGLVVDREFAEESYRAALTALDVARTNAARQSRYLAVYIQPTRPESAAFPRRGVILGLSALFLVLGWSILALIYYSIRDRQ